MGAFETLAAENVNGYTEKKNGLTYLTWSKAWEVVKRYYPDASYSIWKSESGLPYVYDDNTGYMVYTSVTIEGVTHEMWLPVMDGANKAMKNHEYTYKVKGYGGKETEKRVAAATMFDINKSVMRCLTKNLAMFGLGLYIYNGEDLPEEVKTEDPAKTEEVKKTEPDKNSALEEAELRAKVIGFCNRHNMDKEKIATICRAYKVNKLVELSAANCRAYIAALEKQGGNIDE